MTASPDDTCDPLRRTDRLPTRLWTLGHSNQTLEDFLLLLDAHSIEAIADIRRFPGSRRLPQFARPALCEALLENGTGYAWFPELGGRRRPRPDTPNDAWRNVSFRGYADHLHSEEFAEGMARMSDFARQQRTALMCAEVLWWRCHRSLVSDVLKLAGVEVLHIFDQTHVSEHPFTSPARLNHGQLSYGHDGEKLGRPKARRPAAGGA
ncbi:DUF488 domain-containing protein [Stutzerimonas urumqiensis]|uniref:DUF488 domain-containing protein n=1 Tax=Stutzerimonas urumqiensis TaxID=638269 RepID=UPI003DA48672